MSSSQPSLPAKNSVTGAITISPKVIEHHLRRIYERENPSGAWIESGMYQAVRDILHQAIDQTQFPSQSYMAASVPASPAVSPSQPSLAALPASLARNADVFAAFKVHRMQRDMARLLFDDQGNLRTFREWRELAAPIASHQVGPWLETEYDTAVLRAQQAADWQQYEAEADVLPNLRWVPSTSAHPGADHQIFWNTIRPIHDPFWDQHRPGDRWNCKCSLEPTDEPPTPIPTGYELHGNGPQPGLNENPAKTGRLFAQSHPYFPQSCAQCAFYQGGIAGGFKNQEQDCQNCRFIRQCLEQRGTSEFREAKRAIVAEIEQLSQNYSNLQTGVWYQTKKAFKRAINHARNIEELEMYGKLINHVDSLQFERVSPLGEGKDMSNEADRANIQKKRERGVSHYNIYRLDPNLGFGEWIVKTEVYRDRAETVYYLYKEER